ncbi:unnamed protein product [Aspergillus oryzae RIB40]|uniref:DNA, SC020 n=2 Tax=Aspergillus oryzae TaxID=5062 RepID=Q2U3R3_ASPOR|nr:unnamed protein product [Aspergillus oryzae RIB40]EIT76518.1 hypothetical protein Ao3042_07358 [Aspergillus oryzae 3.042]KDE85362.1 hypothetical protein AO1008_00914 [Aspergillus oryzae 100-8]BAE63802.1 unnamed protein product [Aspergillus oryzae RIB40]|eukprot:EIT76518.1 hypothetical protein Ao3042_07358 [Aspergillus oryzae 3.042]
MDLLHIPPKERKSRTSRPKVRTGCVTCKYSSTNSQLDRARRKKCDEARPHCRTCVSAGRECGGYEETIDRRTRAWKTTNATVDVPCKIKLEVQKNQLTVAKDCGAWISRLLVDPSQADLSLSERWYLGLFRSSTASQCSGYFPLEFWRRMVHQFSEVEPAVRHAIIAISALHRSFSTTQSAQNSGKPNDPHLFPLRQCNKAIICLQQRLQSASCRQDSHVLITLVTCVLFVSFAFLQGDTDAASCHLRHGTRLLQETYLSNTKKKLDYGPALTDVFYHLELHWASLREPEAASLNHEHSIVQSMALGNPVWCKPVHSLEDACNLLIGLAWLVCENDPENSKMVVAREILDKHQEAILQKLQTWKTELTTSLTRKKVLLSSRDRHTLAALNLWTEIIFIRVSTDSRQNEGESRFDSFTSNFQRVVQLAKSVLSSDFSQSPMPTFSVGMGMIPPLYLCAFRCRDWHIRREAVQLLQRWQLQEGAWTSSGTAFVVSRMIAIESEGLTPGELVPERARISAMRAGALPDGSGIRLWYRRSQGGSSTQNDSNRNPWESEILPF